MRFSTKRRYSKQSILPEIGEHGQKAIQNASVLCVGAGGLASPVLQYLTAAGVGRIGIVDADVVDQSNLQRQVLFKEHQVGVLKVKAAKENLQKINSSTKIETFDEMLDAQNVEPLFAMYDVIVDATDNFASKYLINDAAVKFGKPLIFASATGLEGQVSVFDSTKGPCYRCVYPESNASIPNCDEAGVLGPVVGMIGSIQAIECLKLIVAQAQPAGSSILQTLVGAILTIDARDLSVFKTKIHKNSECRVCAVAPSEVTLQDAPKTSAVIEAEEILRNRSEYLLIDVREQDEWEFSRVPGAVHMPMSLIRKDATALNRLSADQKWVVHCVSGVRAREAVEICEANGFKAAVLNPKFGFTKLLDLH